MTFWKQIKGGWNAIIEMMISRSLIWRKLATSTREFLCYLYICSKHYKKIMTELQNRRVRGKVSSFVYENKIQWATRKRGESVGRVEFYSWHYLACSVAISTLLHRFDVIQLFLNNIRVSQKIKAYRFSSLKIFLGSKRESRRVNFQLWVLWRFTLDLKFAKVHFLEIKRDLKNL